MPGSDFARLADRIIDEVLRSDPVLASDLGDHRFDDRLPDYAAAAVAERVATLRDALDALSGLDIDRLDRAEQINHEQLHSVLERTLFGLTELREHEWNPLLHNPGGLLHALVSRPYAPLEQRSESLAARLAEIPDSLATARTVLRDCPRIHAEAAVTQFQGTALFVLDEVESLLADTPALAKLVRPTIAPAAAALEEFASWVAPPAIDHDDSRPRLGRRRWEAKLWHTLDTELTAAEILRRAWVHLDQVTEEMREVAAGLDGASAGDRSDDDRIRRALAQLAQDGPNRDSIVEYARRMLDETTAFVAEHDLVTVPTETCVVREMPQFERGVAFAHCDSPGPLEPDGLPTYYCIAPTPADWSAQRVASFYREYNIHMVRDLTVHEAMPGHFLQLTHSRRASAGSRIRALARSGSFVEGWAVLAEEVMAAHGYGGLPVRMQQLKMQLRMVINAIVDQMVHCEDMTEGEAMALMTGRGFQEEGEAAGKWRRALLTSTQLSTYFVGYVEVAAVGHARPAGMSERAWHDAMLSHGSPSPRYLTELMASKRGGERLG